MDPRFDHDLRQNDLANFISHFNDWWDKYGRHALVVVLGVTIALVGWRVFGERRRESQERHWRDLAEATSPEAYRQVALEHDHDAVQAMARLRGGDLALRKLLTAGQGDQPALAEAERKKMIEDAQRLYSEVADDTGLNALYRANAMIGLASVAESKQDWNAAKRGLESVVALAGEQYPYLVTQAKARLDMLPRMAQPKTFSPEPVKPATAPAIPAAEVPGVEAQPANDGESDRGAAIGAGAGNAGGIRGARRFLASAQAMSAAEHAGERDESSEPFELDEDELPLESTAESLETAESSEGSTTDEASEAAEGPARRRFRVRRDRQKRIDVYLQTRLKGISRSRIQKLIDLGGVTINDKTPKASQIVRVGDEIDVILPPKAVRAILPEEIPLHVLYEDDQLIVINKQANLIVHPARSLTSGTMLNALAWRFKQQQEQAGKTFEPRVTSGFNRYDREPHVEGLSNVGGAEFRPGIIHRLDRNTTGCIVLAKSDEAHWAVARQFEARTVLKAYLAVVHGNFDHEGGVIDQPLGKHPTIREAYAVRHDSHGRHSVTIYRVREQYAGYSLVELELKTGRTHQIRVHLTYLGYPIVGDVIYGGEPVGRAELDRPPVAGGARKYVTFARERETGQKMEAEAKLKKDLLIAHPALHAALLQIAHPITRETLRFFAPVHEPVATLIRELRKRRVDRPVVKGGFFVDLGQAVP